MSDLRLSNRNMVSSFSKIENAFRTNPYASYKFVHNSSKNKRGVGILIKNDLKFSEIGRRADAEENYILVMAEINGKNVLLGSIYGPNDHNPGFFENLRNDINSFGEVPVILGGDWNCTQSINNVESNLDCFNMVSPPNLRHSNYLKNLCDDLNLLDPFRCFYPFKREYSYCPRAVGRENRSRLDFFLISAVAFPGLTSCEISPHLQSRLFDHKAICMSFYPVKRNKNNRTSISTEILYDDDIEIVVKTAVYECYLHHIDRNRCNNFNCNSGLVKIGQIWSLLREAGSKYSVRRDWPGGEDRFIFRESCIDDIRLLMNSFNLEQLQSFPLTCDDDIFLDVLLNACKNEVSSYQHFTSKSKLDFKSSIISELKNLTLPNDSIVYNSLEKQLNELVDQELKIEVEKSPIFEHIHNEKASPLFLKLGKSSVNNAKISDICKEDGTPFTSEKERSDFVVNFFKKIYKVPDNFVRPGQNSIRDFLGETVLNNPIVTGSVISELDKNRLDRIISIEELDCAIDEAKTRTAGGPDGIGNAFLKKFWQLLRSPIHRYAKKCFDAGKLSNSLAGGAIRLIPKKGDTSKIKNWRPISLLNCTYKIISRAVNNRLKSVSDTILSRAQKGFTSSRHIQEVLINVIESISYCNVNNVPGSIVSIDMAKAFDSLSHDFMVLVWEFFGFGNTFIKMLQTLTNGRHSCIINDDNSFSASFNIETGTLQGDSPSPLIYNFNNQILLFKLELDPQLSSVFFANLVPRPVFPATPPFANESNGETDKTNGFADDTSVCVRTSLENFLVLKNILLTFGNISGLKCNVEKSHIMAVGDRTVVNQQIMELGFPFTDELTLLGVKINHDLSCLELMHEKTVEKIARTVSFWSRFNLSLPGRISIAKTLCLSQINYIGCIVTPTEAQLNSMSDCIAKFVTGKLNISRERLHLPVSEGGLGFPCLIDFIVAQQAVWVKRAHISTRDNWRYNMKILCNGNCLTLTTEKVDKHLNPILHNIAVSFKKFQSEFYSLNDNYKQAFILDNPLIKRSRFDNLGLNKQFFQQQPTLDFTVLASLKFRDIYDNNGMKTLWELNRDFNLNLNLLTYMRLGAACTNYNNLMLRNRTNSGTSVSLHSFFMGFKKGSKQLRKILLTSKVEKKPVSTRNHTKTYFRLIGEPVAELSTIKQIFSDWGPSYLPNSVREFILKFTSNILGLNVRISHFVEGATRHCTFCYYSNIRVLHDETFLHLFYQCNIVASLLTKFEREFFPEINFTSDSSRRKFWFLHLTPDINERLNIFHRTALWIFKYLIWEAKLKKKTPSYQTIKIDFVFMTENAMKNSAEINVKSKNNYYSISRNWFRTRG
jgi:exonuclease III